MERPSRLQDLPEDIEFQASPGQVRELQEHIAWRDIVAYLEDHILWSQNQLENVKTVEDLRFHQGNIQLARAILALPPQLIHWAEEEIDRQDDGR